MTDKKDKDNVINIFDHKKNKNKLKSEEDFIFIDLEDIDMEKIHELVIEDSPDYLIKNLQIKFLDIPYQSFNQPKTKEEIEEYDVENELQAKALVHAMSYIPVDILEKYMEYLLKFKKYYEEFDKNNIFPNDYDHEYYKFLEDCRESGRLLKEKQKKK